MSLCRSRIGALGLCSLLLAGAPITTALAQPGVGPSYGNPLASYQVPSGIGYWKARQDRAELRRNQGDPAAQAILRQQRHNLCRNQPEVC